MGFPLVRGAGVLVAAAILACLIRPPPLAGQDAPPGVEPGPPAAEPNRSAADAADTEQTAVQPEPPVFSLDVTASAWFASLSGSLQTSKGGGAGTTSKDRPTIDEIGLDGLRVLPLVDARFRFFGDHELHVNYAGIDASGDDTLKEDLTSQDVFFPAGSDVSSSLELDMFRFGYRFLGIPVDLAGWTLAPEIGMSIDPFRYRLRSPTVTGEVDRSYTFAFPYLGLILDGPIFGPLRGEIDVAGSAGLAGATFLDVDARVTCRLLRHGRLEVSAVVGLKGTWLRRRDDQSPEYNDVEVRIGTFSTDPWAGLTAGLRIGF